MLSILGTILVGLVVGFIARAVKPGDDKLGWIMTALLGVAGSFLASYVGTAMGWYAQGDAAGWIASVLGAVVLLVIYSMVNPQLAAAVQRSRRLLHRRALVAAAASTVPVPGLDWAVDAALLSRLLPQISAQFGLTPEQLDQLDPGKREQVQKAVTLVGSVLIGKLITKELVLRITRTVGLRLTTKQLAKYVPLAGQAVAATVGYATLRYLGEQHLRDCVLVVQQSQLQLPVPR